MGSVWIRFSLEWSCGNFELELVHVRWCPWEIWVCGWWVGWRLLLQVLHTLVIKNSQLISCKFKYFLECSFLGFSAAAKKMKSILDCFVNQLDVKLINFQIFSPFHFQARTNTRPPSCVSPRQSKMRLQAPHSERGSRPHHVSYVLL